MSSIVNLLRFKTDEKFSVFDMETNGLHMAVCLPFELAWVNGTQKQGIFEKKRRLIRWKDFRINPEIALKTHFNREEYEKDSIEPEMVIEEFLRDARNASYLCGHNIIGFDLGLLNSVMRRIGMKEEYFLDKVLDTLPLMKGLPERLNIPYQKGDDLFTYQNRLRNIIIRKRGYNTLGALCEILEVDYDEKEAHSGIYDVTCNFYALMKLLHKIDI